MGLTLLCGDETYRLETELARLRTAWVDPAMAAMSHQVLHKPSVSELMESLGTVTFALGGEPVLEVHDFHLFHTTANESEKKQLDSLQALTTDAAQQKQVLFVSPKMDRKLKWTKWLIKQEGLTLSEYKTLPFYKEEDAAQQLVSVAQQDAGIQLHPQAAQQLVNTYGTALQPLMNEVRKLALYEPNQPISPHTVETLCDQSQNLFKLLDDWVLCRDKAKSLSDLQELLLRQHPIQLFGMVQRFLRTLYQLKAGEALRKSPDQLASELNKHPYKIKMDLQLYRPVSFQRVKSLQQQAVTLEYQSKTGQLNDQLALEMLLSA